MRKDLPVTGLVLTYKETIPKLFGGWQSVVDGVGWWMVVGWVVGSWVGVGVTVTGVWVVGSVYWMNTRENNINCDNCDSIS